MDGIVVVEFMFVQLQFSCSKKLLAVVYNPQIGDFSELDYVYFQV